MANIAEKLQVQIKKSIGSRLEQYEPKLGEWPGKLGTNTGVVQNPNYPPGYVYVRDLHGNLITVWNQRVPNQADIWVTFGYDPSEPKLLQIIGQWTTWPTQTFTSIPAHASTHEWPGVDTIYNRGEQFLPYLLRNNGGAGFTVILYPGFVELATGTKLISYQSIDLISYVPTSGATVVLVSIDKTGAVAITTGGSEGSPELITTSDFPVTPAGNRAIAAVRLYAGQTSVQQNASYTDIFDLRFSETFSDLYSAGAVTNPTIIDNGNGTVTLATADYAFFQDASFTAPLIKRTFAGAIYSLTDNSDNFIVASASGVSVLTSDATIDNATIVGLFTIYREGTEIHILPWGMEGSGLCNKTVARHAFIVDSGGLLLSETATRVYHISSGYVWFRANRITSAAFDSSIDECELWYHSAGIWTKTNITAYNNSQYDDGTNLQSLSSGKYAVNWIYKEVGASNRSYVVLGNGNYSLQDATNSGIPTLPTVLTKNFVLAGRIIVKDGDTVATLIENASSDGGFGVTGYVPPVTTALNDFQLGDGAGNWITKTLLQVQTILGAGAVTAGDGIAVSGSTVSQNINNGTAVTSLADGDELGTWNAIATAFRKITVVNLWLNYFKGKSDALYALIANGVTNGDSHNHVGGDGAALNYSGVIATFLGGATVPASAIYYSCPFKATANVTTNQFSWPEGGELSNMVVRTSSTQGGGGSLVCTLVINGTPTAVVITIAASSPAGTYTESVLHTVTISANDLLMWQYQNNDAGAVSAALTLTSMKITKQTT